MKAFYRRRSCAYSSTTQTFCACGVPVEITKIMCQKHDFPNEIKFNCSRFYSKIDGTFSLESTQEENVP